ncbi:palmitoyltransferase akr1 [Candidozyma auris]
MLKKQHQTSEQPREEDSNPTLAKFMSACQVGDLDTVKDLISSRQVSASDTFSEGVTGLHWAAINNRLSVVKYLMENEYSRGDPRSWWELKATPLHWACRTGLVYVVDYFLSHTDADPHQDLQMYNALHLAVHSSNITLCIYILSQSCCEPTTYQGDILTVSALLKYGADVTKTDHTLITPLHWAFIRGYKSVLAALLEAGSDIHHKNDKGKDSFGVSQDMNCQKLWLQVLAEADRDPKNNWIPMYHFLM